MGNTRASLSLASRAVTWEGSEGASPILAVAVHAGHALRPEAAALTALSEDQRLREEDPATDAFARIVPFRGIGVRSRFEVDLNRPRDEAVYVDPADAWGLSLWKERPEEDFVARSRALHDRFYDDLGAVLERTIARHGSAVLLDLHSYNHRRGGAPADPRGAPQVNVGTGTLDRDRWDYLVDRFMDELSLFRLDVRENVKFEGRAVPEFIHTNFPRQACCLAVEFKKIYMDECTGEIYPAEVDKLRRALAATLPGLRDSLTRVAEAAS